MRYIDRLRQALQTQKLDPERFEQTACALLADLYPGLSPIEGGTDFGRDADIYVAGPPQSSTLGTKSLGTIASRLIATTGDPTANLTRSLRRLREEGLETPRLVIACSLSVSGTKRKRLIQQCEDAGLQVPAIYARDALATLLAKAPVWAEYLLGIQGHLPAISDVPQANVEPSLGPLVAARRLVAEGLLATVSSGRDVVVTGMAGVGKSRVVAELTGVHYLEPGSLDHLVADLLDVSPSCVVVDDAHLHLEALDALCRARQIEGLEFSIVAVTWLANFEHVRERIPTAQATEVPLLPRDQMDEIIRAEGVSSIRARHLILDQAEGRPGWAVTLARTIVGGEGENVATGKTLLRQVERYLRDRAGSEVLLDALAHIAVLSRATLDEMQTIAQAVSIPYATLLNSIKNLATDGLLIENSGAWSLQPGLAIPLVAKWFLSEQRMRSWDQVEKEFPEHDHAITFSFLKATAIAETAAVRTRASAWAASLPDPLEWGLDTLDLVRAYSAIDRDASTFASKGAARIMASDRDIEVGPLGITFDALGTAATGQLIYSTQRWFTEEAVHGLLTLASSDDRPRHQHPTHPMRVLADVAQHLGPDNEQQFSVRELLVDSAQAWLVAQGEDPRRTTIWAEAIRAALSPELSGNWNDPSNYANVTLAWGVEPASRLEHLVTVWDRVSSQMPELALPNDAVAHLLGLWEQWLRCAAGLSNSTATPGSDQRTAAERGAWSMLRSLRPYVAAVPGLALSVTQTLDRAQHWGLVVPEELSDIPLDPELLLLVGRRDIYDQDVEAWLGQRDEEVRQLAQQLASCYPEKGIERFEELAEQARLVRPSDGTGRAAYNIADYVLDPLAWLNAALVLPAPQLVAPLLARARTNGAQLDEATLLDNLQKPSLRPGIIGGVLSGGTADGLAIAVLDQLTVTDLGLVENYLYRDPDDLTRALLGHRSPEIAGLAALSFHLGTSHERPIPEQWQSLWDRAFLGSATLSARTQGFSSYRIQQTLSALIQTRPQLCEQWLDEALSASDRAHDLDDAAPLLAQLPRDARARLASRRPRSYSFAGDTFLVHLLEPDPSLASELLEQGRLDPADLLHALWGHRNNTAVELSKILLAWGTDANQIVSALTSAQSWGGNESDHIAGLIAWFEDAAATEPLFAPITMAAVPGLQELRLSALADEEREAILGYR